MILTFSGLAEDQALRAIEHLQQTPSPGELLHVDYILVGSRFGREQVPFDRLTRCIQDPNNDLGAFCNWFFRHSTLILDGRKSRINLVDQQSAENLQQPPQSSFQVLFRDDAKRHEVRRIVFEAFRMYLVIDPTDLGRLRIRLSQQPPDSDLQERGIHAEAVDFHRNAEPIDRASDG